MAYDRTVGSTLMETSEFIKTVGREGSLLSLAARQAGEDAAVPSCPEWRVRDLVEHTGRVHRWVIAFVTEGHTGSRPLPAAPDVAGEALLQWFDEGHAALVEALSAAPDDLACWTFRPTPAPRAWWARRQAHETAIHRADAELATGGRPTGAGPEFAADGIDELLVTMHGRSRSRARTDVPRVLRVRATDTDDVWTVRLSAEPPVTVRGAAGEADCEVTGPVADLYLALWNRLPFPAVSGDRAVADLWRERSGIG